MAFLRWGYYEYKSIWSPTVGETLRLTIGGNEANDGTYQSQDPFAVAVIKDGCVVRHVPSRVSRTVSFSFGKDWSAAFCEVTGAMVNRATGFGQELSRLYRFYACQAYIERFKNLLL